MKTNFQLKLESLCRIMRKGERHWILTGAQIVRIPDSVLISPDSASPPPANRTFTTKRAIYAAFVGEVPKGMDVLSGCSVSACVNPEHMVLRLSRTEARGLSLPEELEALKKPARRAEPEKPSVLPKGITARVVATVKHMGTFSTLAEIRNATGLSYSDIMKIRAGKYDDAVRSVKEAVEGTRAPGVGEISVVAELPGGRTVSKAEAASGLESGVWGPENKDLSEEERLWLEMVKRG